MKKLKTLLLCVLMMLASWNPSIPSNVIHVLDPHDLPKVSALLLMSETSGSSTVISSSPQGSDLLTNAHVCEGAVKGGGFAILDGKRYEMTAIKPSEHVDLCLVHVKEDLNIRVELSDKAPAIGDEILTGGYPLTLPLVIQRGFTSRMINVGDRKEPNYLLVLSILAQPGHSGTGVFDADGKLVAAIDAIRLDHKNADIGFALAVPLRDIKIFMEKESLRLPWKLVPHVKRP